MAQHSALVALVLLTALATAQAYPNFWAEEYAPTCASQPTGPKDCHKSPKQDSSTSITVLDGSGKAVTSVCPGQSYTIEVKFPEDRLSFVALSGGTVGVRNAANKRCPNTQTFAPKTGFQPSKSFTVRGTAPASGSWTISVTSATGTCGAFLNAQATVPMGKC